MSVLSVFRCFFCFVVMRSRCRSVSARCKDRVSSHEPLSEKQIVYVIYQEPGVGGTTDLTLKPKP